VLDLLRKEFIDTASENWLLLWYWQFWFVFRMLLKNSWPCSEYQSLKIFHIQKTIPSTFFKSIQHFIQLSFIFHHLQYENFHSLLFSTKIFYNKIKLDCNLYHMKNLLHCQIMPYSFQISSIFFYIVLFCESRAQNIQIQCTYQNFELGMLDVEWYERNSVFIQVLKNGLVGSWSFLVMETFGMNHDIYGESLV